MTATTRGPSEPASSGPASSDSAPAGPARSGTAPFGPVPAAPAGALAPFRHTVFAVLWAATVFGTVGTFMRDVASQWIVSGLTPSPAAVAMIQAAGTLPIFLLAIPAGVLSDILDRRRFLIAVQAGLALVSLSLATLAAFGAMNVSNLVLLTFLGGIGAALVMPTWQAIVPELVPRAELKSAVALNSLGFNISRAIGPAMGGLILSVAGAAATYGADVVTYLIVIAALLWWRRPAKEADDLGEHFGGAMRAGLRYALASRTMHRVLWRAALFFAFGSAVWALLPLVARVQLGGGPGFYGVMLGSLGAGAIAGAVVMPRLRARLGQDGLVLAATVLAGLAAAVLGLARVEALALAATFLLGGAWIAVVVTLNAATQAILPNWVRGRGLAVYLTVFNGAMAAGALSWGVVAEVFGIDMTLLAAALCLVALAPLTFRAKLPQGEADLTPSGHWPEPAISARVEHDRGPVSIMVTYRVDPGDRDAFLDAAAALAETRRAGGASSWSIAEDTADPGVLVETFVVPSWAEHLRQHKRVSQADAEIQARLQAFHRGAEPPTVVHLLALSTGGRRRANAAGHRRRGGR